MSHRRRRSLAKRPLPSAATVHQLVGEHNRLFTRAQPLFSISKLFLTGAVWFFTIPAVAVLGIRQYGQRRLDMPGEAAADLAGLARQNTTMPYL
jgi:hypothetical protein